MCDVAIKSDISPPASSIIYLDGSYVKLDYSENGGTIQGSVRLIMQWTYYLCA